MNPGRVQLSRRAGFKLGDAVKVDRSTRWGNPHTCDSEGSRCRDCGAVHSRQGAIEAYRRDLLAGRRMVPSPKRPHLGHTIEDVRRELPGKVLACWCPLDLPRHADVLLEIANGGGGDG